MENTYNGWTNYATWRVNLEIFDGVDVAEYGFPLDIDGLSEAIEEFARDTVTDYENITGLAADYALAFLSDVNWREIAEHLIPEQVD